MRIALAVLLVIASCGGSEGDSPETTRTASASADPTTSVAVGDTGAVVATTTADTAPSTSNANGESIGEAPDACGLLVLADWEAVTGLDLDVHPTPPGSSTPGDWCGVTLAGETLPFRGEVQVNNGVTVENLELFIESYPEMEVVEGIGDRALYSDVSIMGSPSIAFTKNGVEVFVNLDTPDATRQQVEQLAKSAAAAF
jgi:hypothetical protein